MAFTARTTLPSDFDIFSPLSSTTKPWVRTVSKGAVPVVPTAVRIDDWNQPRCWSDPSRYMNAGIAQPEILGQHGAMARSRLEPDVEDVAFLPERRAAALGTGCARRRQLLDRPGEPGVGSLGAEEIAEMADRLGGQELVMTGRAAERGDRHAPRCAGG